MMEPLSSMTPATVYYLPGTTGWGSTFGGVPAVLWNPQANSFSFTGGQFGFNLTGPTNAVIVVEACHESGPSGLDSGEHQHPDRRHDLFQRSAMDELSRPFLPPPLALTVMRQATTFSPNKLNPKKLYENQNSKSIHRVGVAGAARARAGAIHLHDQYDGVSVTITGYSGGGGAVVIPATTNGYPVTAIGDYAFIGHNTLTGVIIPNSVTGIGDGAFEYCSGLTNVTIGNSVTNIGDGAFEYCSGLTSVTIPNNVTSLARSRSLIVPA